MSTRRHRKEPREPREILYNFRCTEAERVIMDECAAAHGFEDVAPWLRKIIAEDYSRNSHRTFRGVLNKMMNDSDLDVVGQNGQTDTKGQDGDG